jgi:flavin reductase (DIM6/NTAB) family NADH-FMN oxidoreductase RutF
MPEETILEAVNRFTYGVYIISTRRGAEANAMCAGWVMQVSMEPIRVAVGMNYRSYTREMIADSGVFAVNVLREGQQALGRHFGLQSGRDTDKMAGIPTHTAETGAPILDDCAAWLDCRLVQMLPVGDHFLVLGEPIAGGVGTGEKMVCRSEDYWTKDEG